MSSPNNNNDKEGEPQGEAPAAHHGAYVPPHKRGQAPSAKMPPKTPPPPQQRKGGGANNRQGRSPASSPTRNNKNRNQHHNNSHHGPHHHGSSNHSGGSGHHGNNRNKGHQHQSKSHSPNRNNNRQYHSPTRKEDLMIQKQQLQVLLDALDRICCINLDRRDDRWKSFQQHLHQSLGKKMGHALWQRVERTSAVDGIPDDFSPSQVESTWDATINAKWDRHISPPMLKEMTPGEVGCALSHVKLWRELAMTPPVVAAAAVEGGEDNAVPERLPTMMILEDDALFYSPKLAMNKAAIGNTTTQAPSSGGGRGGGGGGRGQQQQQQQQQQHNNNDHSIHDSHNQMSIANHDFLTAFQMAWTQSPEDWDIWYLGFSDRGERLPVEHFHLPKPKPHHHNHEHHHHHYPSMSIEIFRPTYGFHTHGYVLSSKAAQKLLDNLPVKGPLDVWLADNEWFGLKAYCSVVQGEGWHGTGAWLITQNRKKVLKDSDIHQSGRTDAAATES